MSEAMTGLKVRKALKDHKAIPVARKAHPARKAISVHKVLQEVTVPKALKALKERLAVTAPKVRKALKDRQAMTVHKVLKVIPVHKDRKAVTVPKVHKALKDRQAMTAHKALKALKARKPLPSPASTSMAPTSPSIRHQARALVRFMSEETTGLQVQAVATGAATVLMAPTAGALCSPWSSMASVACFSFKAGPAAVEALRAMKAAILVLMASRPPSLRPWILGQPFSRSPQSRM